MLTVTLLAGPYVCVHLDWTFLLCWQFCFLILMRSLHAFPFPLKSLYKKHSHRAQVFIRIDGMMAYMNSMDVCNNHIIRTHSIKKKKKNSCKIFTPDCQTRVQWVQVSSLGLPEEKMCFVWERGLRSSDPHSPNSHFLLFCLIVSSLS